MVRINLIISRTIIQAMNTPKNGNAQHRKAGPLVATLPVMFIGEIAEGYKARSNPDKT